MMTIHSKVCRRISRNRMSWIMMLFNQTFQLNRLRIWIVQLSSFSDNDDVFAKVIERENEESEDDQDDDENKPPRRPSTNEVVDALETLQDLSIFSMHEDEIHSLVLNMERLLDRERIDNLKQSVVTDLFKRR